MILFYYCDEIFSNENERPENVEKREKTVMHLKGKSFYRSNVTLYNGFDETITNRMR